MSHMSVYSIPCFFPGQLPYFPTLHVFSRGEGFGKRHRRTRYALKRLYSDILSCLCLFGCISARRSGRWQTSFKFQLSSVDRLIHSFCHLSSFCLAFVIGRFSHLCLLLSSNGLSMLTAYVMHVRDFLSTLFLFVACLSTPRGSEYKAI